MSFACIYIPNFIFQAAARAEPEMRHRPVAIVEGKTLVVAVNSAALKAGIEPGMTAIQVAQVASVAIRARAPAQEQIAHAALLDLGFSFSPRVEDTGLTPSFSIWPVSNICWAPRKKPSGACLSEPPNSALKRILR